jgi:hypothetical protein
VADTIPYNGSTTTVCLSTLQGEAQAPPLTIFNSIINKHDATAAVALQVNTIVQLLVEVRHLSDRQHLSSISLHSIEQLKVQLNSLRSKLRSHIVELQASNPLYKQIPYMGHGMEQEDCSIPAAAWQRAAGQQLGGELSAGSIGSHAVLVDAEQLEQLQAAFAELESLLLDPRSLQQHNSRIAAAEEVLQANMKCSSWLRALEVCKQLSAEHALDPKLQQELATELAALCAVLSPDHLAVKLQQHSLARGGSSSSSRSGVLPPTFVLQVTAGFAAFRRQHLQNRGQQRLSYADAAALCQHLQQAAEGSGGIASKGDSLIAQFELLQLLYRQSSALTDTISSGTNRCSAVLAPLGLTLVDAATLVAPADVSLLLKLAGSTPASMPSAEAATGCALYNASGAATFAYSVASQQQQQQLNAVEVFQASAWLLQWQQGLLAIQSMAAAAAKADSQPQLVSSSSSSSNIQGQLAASLALAAACATAAGSCSSAAGQLQGRAAVRTSSALLGQQQQQLAEIALKRRATEATISKLLQAW